MGGISGAVSSQTPVFPLDIFIESGKYRINYSGPYDWVASDENLLDWTKNVLAVFRRVERAVKQANSVSLDPSFCKKQLEELAMWGGRAYKQIFKQTPTDIQIPNLVKKMSMGGTLSVAPTIHSKQVLFPWEVLYEDDAYWEPNPDIFWGVRYPVARVLTPGRDVWSYVSEQMSPSDMLFCLHHKLKQSHESEWPEIKRLVALTNRDRCDLLRPLAGPPAGKPLPLAILEHIYAGQHNMIHFACHCKTGKDGADALIISLIQGETIREDEDVIEIETYTFVDLNKPFQSKPLIFLNACESAGGVDELRTIFNLPGVFIQSNAAAVVATACPVPDIFAASFAKTFYEFFMSQRLTIGEALRRTRDYFLKVHQNPLGFAYGLYSPAHYRLAPPPHGGGV